MTETMESTALKSLLYFDIAVTLVASPLYIDLSQVRSMVALYLLILAGVCLTNSLANLKVMRQPNWAWDQIFLPISGTLAMSWLAL